jgi:hypothetical protein
LSSDFLSSVGLAAKFAALKGEVEANNPGAAVAGVIDSGFLSAYWVDVPVPAPIPKNEVAGC